MKVKSLSRIRLFATLWTVVHQAPPSMGFSRQEYWSELPFPSQTTCIKQNKSQYSSHMTWKLYILFKTRTLDSQVKCDCPIAMHCKWWGTQGYKFVQDSLQNKINKWEILVLIAFTCYFLFAFPLCSLSRSSSEHGQNYDSLISRLIRIFQV